jgi:P27 family predicted phage terminase small subunit
MWEAYWVSDVAKIATDLDVGAVEVYFMTLDEWRRCVKAARKQRFVEGSMGQPRINPLAERADKLAALLPKLAAEIGLSPKARTALAINVGQAAKTIEDLNREVEEAVSDDYAGITTLVEPGTPVADEG